MGWAQAWCKGLDWVITVGLGRVAMSLKQSNEQINSIVTCRHEDMQVSARQGSD